MHLALPQHGEGVPGPPHTWPLSAHLAGASAHLCRPLPPGSRWHLLPSSQHCEVSSHSSPVALHMPTAASSASLASALHLKMPPDLLHCPPPQHRLAAKLAPHCCPVATHALSSTAMSARTLVPVTSFSGDNTGEAAAPGLHLKKVFPWMH